VNENFARAVAAGIRHRFRNEGCSCADLAKVLGRSHNLAWSRWSGRRPYRVDELREIARFLDVRMSTLLGEVPTAEPQRLAAAS
jgi:transcriptional regulator with XRE-family HTH domain